MTTTAASFYIHRKGRALGPCSLEELRTYLAYGSVKPDELVAEAGTDHWQPARQIFVSATAEPDDTAFDPPHGVLGWLQQRWQQWSKPAAHDELEAALKTRRRVVRYRDWDKVPAANRSSDVLMRMFLGFCFFPPSLWLACSRVFSSRVIRPAADEDGYLKSWPTAMQSVCTVLIVVNAIVWSVGIYAAVHYAGPVVREASAAFLESVTQFVDDVIKGR